MGVKLMDLVEGGSFWAEPGVHDPVGAVVEYLAFESFIGVVAIFTALALEIGFHEHQLQFVGFGLLLVFVGVVLLGVLLPLLFVFPFSLGRSTGTFRLDVVASDVLWLNGSVTFGVVGSSRWRFGCRASGWVLLLAFVLRRRGLSGWVLLFAFVLRGRGLSGWFLAVHF